MAKVMDWTIQGNRFIQDPVKLMIELYSLVSWEFLIQKQILKSQFQCLVLQMIPV